MKIIILKNGSIEFTESYLTIKRKGLQPAKLRFKGDLDIRFSDISSVSIKEPTLLMPGYISFTINGISRKKVVTANIAHKDEYSLTYKNKSLTNDLRKLKEKILMYK